MESRCLKREAVFSRDRFGGISVRKTCNRLKFSVREMSSRVFLINALCFRRDKNDVLGFSETQ